MTLIDGDKLMRSTKMMFRSVFENHVRMLAIAIGCGSTMLPAAADDYPNKPVTMVVPTAAAGGTDTVARLVAQRLGVALGQQVIVENRAGANGTIGTQVVARAKPDGYTVLFTYAAAHVASPSLYKSLGYDVLKDFAPVAEIARGGNLLLVRSDFPAKTVKEYVEYVKARPGKLSYCSWGIGSGGHLTMESLNKQAGLTISHVPYKGSAPCVQDLLGGQVNAAFSDVSSIIGQLKADKVRALVYSGPTPLATLPNTPTMNDAGYPFNTFSWYGVFAPAKTPPHVVARLNAEINKILADPAFRVRMAELNMPDVTTTTPEQFGKIVQQDMSGWGQLIRDNGVQME